MMQKKKQKKHPFRMTRQRCVILEELRKVDSHPTADEVYEMVRRRMSSISLGTVYRNLEILSRQGLLQKVVMGGAQKRFDGTTEDHYHVRCVLCGSVDDIAAEPIPDLQENLRFVSEYEVTGHRIEFTGVCPLCKKSCKIATDVNSQEDGRR